MKLTPFSISDFVPIMVRVVSKERDAEYSVSHLTIVSLSSFSRDVIPREPPPIYSHWGRRVGYLLPFFYGDAHNGLMIDIKKHWGC